MTTYVRCPLSCLCPLLCDTSSLVLHPVARTLLRDGWTELQPRGGIPVPEGPSPEGPPRERLPLRSLLGSAPPRGGPRGGLRGFSNNCIDELTGPTCSRCRGVLILSLCLRLKKGSKGCPGRFIPDFLEGMVVYSMDHYVKMVVICLSYSSFLPSVVIGLHWLKSSSHRCANQSSLEIEGGRC